MHIKVVGNKNLSHIQNHKIKFKKKKKKIIVDVTDATNDSKPHTKRSDARNDNKCKKC